MALVACESGARRTGGARLGSSMPEVLALEIISG